MQVVMCERSKMMGWRRAGGLAIAVTMQLLSVSAARANSDAGPPNGACSDAGRAEWIACESDSECPSDQRCRDMSICVCAGDLPEPSEGCSVAPGGGGGGVSLVGLALLGLLARRRR